MHLADIVKLSIAEPARSAPASSCSLKKVSLQTVPPDTTWHVFHVARRLDFLVRMSDVVTPPTRRAR